MQEYRGLLQNRQQRSQQQTYKSITKIRLIVLNIALSSFYFGYCITYLGQFDIKEIQAIFSFNLSLNVASGVLNGCIPVGALIGALISSFLIRKLSRRNFLLFWNALALVAVGCTFIQNFYTLFFSRVLQGICVGAYSTIAPLIIKELAPIQISGTLGSYAQLSITFGVFFAYILNYALEQITLSQTTGRLQSNISAYWRIIFGVPGLIVLVQTLVLLFVFPYETPRYLLSVGREQEAKKLIELIYKEECVDQIFMQKIADMIVSGSRRNNISEASSGKRYINRYPIIAAVHLTVLQQFSGINAVVVYGGDIAKKLINSIDTYALLPSLIYLVQVLATFATGYALAKIGRKPIIQFGTLFLAIANLLVAIGFLILNQSASDLTGQNLIIVGLFLYMAVFGFGLGPLVWLYIPEIVEDKIVPFTTAANWLSASIVIILVPIITADQSDTGYSQIQVSIIFFIFMVWCFGSFFFNQKYVIESRNKTFRDIQQQYSVIRPLKLC